MNICVSCARAGVDSCRYWWGELLGETNRLMVPDAEHTMATGIFILVPAMINYYNAINLK